MKALSIFFLISCLFFLSCSSKKENLHRTFASDIDLLAKVPGITILQNNDCMVAVSGELQGRVFTSSSRGRKGQSYGWFNRQLIRENKFTNNINALGGEGRFWFGPEVGDFSIFFDKGKAQIAENIKISPDLSTVKFRAQKCNNSTLYCNGELKIRNSFGNNFLVNVRRKITLLPSHNEGNCAIETNVEKQTSLSSVGFSTETWATNIGASAWTKETGLLSIWDIGCMLPSENTVVILPLKQTIDSLHSYFTQLHSSRVKIQGKTAFYSADAKYMNKIGVLPQLCTGTFGAYNPELNLLTIVTHSLNPKGQYVNNHWEATENFGGDAINVFNGEVNSAEDRHWPFFEIESLSDTRELEVGETLYHKQTIFHYEGAPEDLNPIAKQSLGVTISQIPNVASL